QVDAMLPRARTVRADRRRLAVAPAVRAVTMQRQLVGTERADADLRLARGNVEIAAERPLRRDRIRAVDLEHMPAVTRQQAVAIDLHLGKDPLRVDRV